MTKAMNLSSSMDLDKMHACNGETITKIPFLKLAIDELARQQTDVPVYSLHPEFVESSFTASLLETILNSWCQGDFTNCRLIAAE